MQQIINKIRDKYTYCILLLFVPLEVLPFLCEPDSAMGKALLLIKAALFGLLYILYADKQKWYIHIMLLITCVSMGVSVYKHGGVGTALLILSMFFALIAFPQIEIEENRLRCLYLLLAIGGVGIAIYGMILNYTNGIAAFSWRGSLNPNTFGMILLSVLFYSLSSIQLKAKKLTIWIDFALISVLFFLIVNTGCRSALLCVVAFVFFYVISRKIKFVKAVYFVFAIFSVLFCLAIALFELELNVSETANEIEFIGKKVFSGREQVWSVALEGFIDSPFWGQAGEYLVEYTCLSSAHSVFMGMLVAVGLIPCLMYLKIIFCPSRLLNYNFNIEYFLPVNKIAFISSFVVASFECAYTDNRLNFLLLPLLFGIGNEVVENSTANCNSSIEQMKEKKTRVIPVLVIICFLLFGYLCEPMALQYTHHALPQKADQKFLDEIGYGNSKLNVLQELNYSSKEMEGVIWEWNGGTYDVLGTAEGYTFADIYTSQNQLPEWAVPGKQYHAIYEADKVRLRMYYFKADGKYERFVDTNTSIDFVIPKESVGLAIILVLDEGETTFESAMPIIYPKEIEPKEMTERKGTISNKMDDAFLEQKGYDEKKGLSVLDGGTFASQELAGVTWSWNGETYDVLGTAEGYTFADIYTSQNQLPEWAVPGKQYHVIYEADKVRLRMYYFKADGKYERFVDTNTSVDFVIPKESVGLAIILVLDEGETTFESAMPIIYPIETK